MFLASQSPEVRKQCTEDMDKMGNEDRIQIGLQGYAGFKDSQFLGKRGHAGTRKLHCKSPREDRSALSATRERLALESKTRSV